MPDNAIYYQVAYGAAALIFGVYITTLGIRIRRAHRRAADRNRRHGLPSHD